MNPLGQGVNGRVFAGTTDESEMPVAIKTFWHHDDEDSKMTNFDYRRAYLALLFEAQVNSFLSERSVGSTQIIGSGILPVLHNDHYYPLPVIAFEKAESSLKQIRITHLNQVKDILDQVFEQVEKLHKLGVIHGDLKSGNILVFPDENNNRKLYKLSDFGSVKHIPDSNFATYFKEKGVELLHRQTALISAISPFAPELNSLNEKTAIYEIEQFYNRADRRTLDIHSLGRLISELIAKFDSTDINTKLFQNVIDKAQSQSPEDRYQTVAELREALNKAFPEV